MENKFEINDMVNYKIPMYDSYLHHKAKVTKLFKNGKVRIEFHTWAGHLNKYNVEANKLESLYEVVNVWNKKNRLLEQVTRKWLSKESAKKIVQDEQDTNKEFKTIYRRMKW